MHSDVIIVGGSYAGLSAATQLARARRRITVIDAGRRRNRFAERSHGFLSRDGADAAEIVEEARKQLLAYETVRWIDGEARRARRRGDGFELGVDGAVETADRLVLATGVCDELPDIPGLAERWGRSVFHCPYCHGYEIGQGRIGLIATSENWMHLAMMLPDWGMTTVFANSRYKPDAEQSAALEKRGVTVLTGEIARIEEAATCILEDGRRMIFDGLFVATRVAPASPLAEELGCEMLENAFGRTVVTDMMKATSVAGIYACGDAARFGGSVPLAVGDGTIAGAAAHQSLIFGARRKEG